MIAAPGSTLWLLRHELRLLWRGTSKKLPILAIVLLVLFQLLAFAIAAAVMSAPPIPAQYMPLAWASVSGLSIVGLLIMLSSGLVACVKVIYARGDMNLLLSSPIKPQSIVLVRAGAIAITLMAGFGVLILPFANALGLLVSPKWFTVYPALACLALFASSLSLLMALSLFRALGARRTRVVAQILGGIVGTAAFLATQLPNMMSTQGRDAATSQFVGYMMSVHWPSTDRWVWLPARALMGEPLPLLAAIALSVGLFIVVACGLSEGFIASMVAAGGNESRASKRKGGVRRFNTGTVSVLRRKELRLIGRDPWLLTQILQQTMFAVPLAFMSLKFGIGAVPLVWLVLIFIAGNLAGIFGWLAVSAEDAPDLVSTAPLQPLEVFRAKLEATILPVAVGILPPIALAWYFHPWLGQTLLVCCTGVAVSSALIQVLHPAAGKRSEFNKRAQGRFGVNITELALSAAWVGTGAAMLFSPWGTILGLILLLFPLTTVLRTWRAGAPVAILT